MLVFSGTLGEESPPAGSRGAVAGKIADLETYEVFSARNGFFTSNGGAGVIQLFLRVPPKHEAEWQAGLASSQVVFDEQTISNWGQVKQEPYNVRVTGQTGAIDGLFEWNLFISPDNQVVYTTPSGGTIVSTDQYANDYLPYGYLPFWANELLLSAFHTPCTTHTAALILNGKTVFSFKFRLESDANGSNVNLVMWDNKNISVRGGAFQVLSGAEKEVDCPV
jgi:hypothetical protein